MRLITKKHLILTILHDSVIIGQSVHIYVAVTFAVGSNVSKKNLLVAARRIFECVRTRTIPEAEREAKLWDWLAVGN